MKKRIDIEHLAKLAHLKLTQAEKEKFGPQLEKIFNLFEQLRRLDTQDIPPTFQTIPLKNVAREDKVGSCLNPKEALENAKQKKGNYFKTKPIFLKD